MALSPNINVMLRAAERAGRSLLKDFGEVEQLQVSKKGPGDFVSKADHRSEEIIFNELSKARPEYGFLMEERGEIKGKTNARWIVDPLDGTTNFLHGIPHWNLTIALEEAGEIVAGIVYDPIRDEMFRAEKGNGAFLRNKRLHVSGRRTLGEALIATGAPHLDKVDGHPFVKQVFPALKAATAFRSMGAAALDLCYVAAGRYDAYWEYFLNPWDVAAGSLIVREAAGMVSTIENTGNVVYGRQILAANGHIFSELKTLLNKALKEKSAA